jgi:predicted MFS family arabinose efflux permease
VSPPGAARHRGLAPPWLLIITAGCALGGITAFVPLRFAASSAAPASLFLMSAAVVAGRWAAGSWSDRAGGRHLLVSGITACALGLAGLAAAIFGATALILPGAAVYGLGLGALQNDTLVIMFRRAGPGGHGTASTAWNIAVDAGTGIGATAIGWGSDILGLGGAFAVCAALIAALTPVAFTIRARERPPRDARNATHPPAGGPATCGSQHRGPSSETE